MTSDPDAPVTVLVGDAVLVPGECAQALGADTHGHLQIRVVGGHGKASDTWVRLRRSSETTVALTRGGDLEVVGHRRCDDAVPVASTPSTPP